MLAPHSLIALGMDGTRGPRAFIVPASAINSSTSQITILAMGLKRSVVIGVSHVSHMPLYVPPSTSWQSASQSSRLT